MERAVTYSVVARKKPNDLEGSAKYYALAQARGEMGIREMADRIQQMCTVMRDGLCAGEIVRLGDLGSFQSGLNGEGSAMEEEYHTGLIKKAHINFRPGADLSDILTSLGYERVPVKTKNEE